MQKHIYNNRNIKTYLHIHTHLHIIYISIFHVFEIFTRIFIQSWCVLQVYPSEEIVGTLARKDPTAAAQLRRSQTTCCDYEASETWEMTMKLEGMKR